MSSSTTSTSLLMPCAWYLCEKGKEEIGGGGEKVSVDGRFIFDFFFLKS